MTIELITDPCSACLGIAWAFVLFIGWQRLMVRRAEITIIELLADGPSYGLDLVNNSGGRLRSGSVYVHLARLEEDGFVKSWEVNVDPASVGAPTATRAYRRMYALVTREDG